METASLPKFDTVMFVWEESGVHMQPVICGSSVFMKLKLADPMVTATVMAISIMAEAMGLSAFLSLKNHNTYDILRRNIHYELGANTKPKSFLQKKSSV
jgi:hypothetical protein